MLATHLPVQALTPSAFAPFGWVLGRPYPASEDPSAYTHPMTDFWTQHQFQSGSAEGAEILWVNYRNTSLTVGQLEKHLLTEQAIIALSGSIIQIMATSLADGSPDMRSATAFVVPQGQGICMRPHAWHATRVLGDEVRCLMLTRASTTRDLVHHLTTGQPSQESAISDIAPCHVVMDADCSA